MAKGFGRTIRTPKKPCPHCGYELDSHSIPFSLETPSPGDLSVCIDCGGLLKFGKGLTLQVLPQDEIFEVILADPKAYAELMAVRDAILTVKSKRGDRNG